MTGKEIECKTESLAEISKKKLTEAERKQNQKIGKMTINKEDKRKIKADGKRPQGWKIQVVYTVI